MAASVTSSSCGILSEALRPPLLPSCPQESPRVGAKFAWRVTNVSYDPASGAVSEWLAVGATYGLEGAQLQLRMNAAGLAERSATYAFVGSVEVEVSPILCQSRSSYLPE